MILKKEMLQAVDTDLFNQLVPKAHNSVKIYYFFYKISSKVI